MSEWQGLPIPVLDGFSGFVPPSGTGTYHVMLVGEAPGEQEARTSRPFYEQAPAGAVLSRLLKRAGLDREQFVVSNAVWSRPPGNYLDSARYEGEAIEAYAGLRQKLFEMYRPRVVVALGGVALRTLTNYGGRGATITSVQGYVLDSSQWDGVYVIPTLHPSAILRGEQRMSGAVIWALQHAIDIARNGFVRQPTSYVTHAGLDEALAFEQAYDPSRHILSLDIETPESSSMDEEDVDDKIDDISYNINRISFCYESPYAITFPWQPPYTEVARRLLASPGPKRTWNGDNFDIPRLRAAGMEVNGRHHDMMNKWHFLQPTLPRGLAFVAPFYGWTGEPWKNLNSSEPEFYSCCDSDALQRIGDGVDCHLKQQGAYEICERHVVDLGEVLQKMSRNGLPYSVERAREFEQELEAKWNERKLILQQRIPTELCRPKQKTGYKKVPKDTTGLTRRKFKLLGNDLTKEELASLDFVPLEFEIYETERWCQLVPFNPGSQGEDGQVADFVKHYGYRIGTNRKTKKGTVDDETLKKLLKKVRGSKRIRDIEFVELLQVIRECRQLSKVLGTYVKGWRPGTDGRIHTTYGFWGRMFRVSARRPNISATIQDKNEEAIAKGFRKCVTAREGHVLLECDWKSMESVLVAYFANDPDYDRLSRLGVHDYVACHLLVDRGKRDASSLPELSWPDADLKQLFKETKRQFPKDRDDAKHCCHGIAYGLGHRLMADMYEMSEKDAKRLIDMFFTLFPKIKAWQMSVLDRASKETRLTNPFAYRMSFYEVYRWDTKYQRWALGEDAKSAIAFLPRDTGAAMLKEVLLRLAERHGLADSGVLLASTHDSILCEPRCEDLEQVARILHEEMVAPVPQLGGLTIPVELKAGSSWHDSLMEGYELSAPVEK